ncbi:MAG: hypothetical protein JW861_13515 [Bacteroidales bacterium]|nr:hypothetical protein [Bacteroidales bacterium]
MNNDYLIRLIPLAPYYFGQELNHELGNRNNYFQHSASFPQQSALLGLIRHQILLQHDLIPLEKGNNSSEALKLIGGRSFNAFPEDIPDDNKPNDFGKIVGLSPVFLTNASGKKFFLRDREIVWHDKDKRLYLLEVAGSKYPYKLILSEKNEDFISKFPFVSYLAGTADDLTQPDQLTEAETVLKKAIFTGIHKKWGICEHDDSYFRRTYRHLAHTEVIRKEKEYPGMEFRKKILADEWGFGFIVRFSSDFDFSEQERTVFFGKERSVFLMKCTRISENDFRSNISDYLGNSQIRVNNGLVKAVLLSGTFLTGDQMDEVKRHCALILSEKERFRNIRSNISKHTYQRPDKSPVAIHMIRRGSVFFIQEEFKTQFEEIICDDHAVFRQIGYNYMMFQ